ncbi:MAG TPA: hypothetical protein VHM89_06545 [Acidimicrobiales bacterium]|nr:hypothetical protein [Acidimicrobiales bacterium]
MGEPSADVTSRIRTRAQLDVTPAFLSVEWIAWDSGFRGSGLEPGDRIVEVDGVPLEVPADQPERSRWLAGCIGQIEEAQRWQAAGASEGHVVLQAARRRDPGGQGWQTIEAKGTLQPDRSYETADHRRALAPGGPDSMGYDGFSGTWGSWYEEGLVRKLSSVLDDGWNRQSLVTRSELTSLCEERPRVDFLVEHYPGPFADAVKADFDAAVACLTGRRYELTDADLDDRRADDERAAQVAGAGRAAWDDLLAGLAADTMPAFPASHPVRDGLAAAAGKVVVLPELGNDSWVAEAGHGWFVAGSPDENWYFVDAEAEPAQAMLVAAGRYRKVVAPDLAETYLLCGRIQPEARLLMIGERAYFGAPLELLGALVGGAMFVDVTKRRRRRRSLRRRGPVHQARPAAAARRRVTGPGAPGPVRGAEVRRRRPVAVAVRLLVGDHRIAGPSRRPALRRPRARAVLGGRPPPHRGTGLRHPRRLDG